MSSRLRVVIITADLAASQLETLERSALLLSTSGCWKRAAAESSVDLIRRSHDIFPITPSGFAGVSVKDEVTGPDASVPSGLSSVQDCSFGFRGFAEGGHTGRLVQARSGKA